MKDLEKTNEICHEKDEKMVMISVSRRLKEKKEE
jgi:hypothetical protein